MTLGPVLDVAIGMTMTYLLLSIIATALQESVASFLSLRGTKLRDALKGLLQGAANDAALANHAMVRGVSGKANLPSYVEPANFACSVVDFLADGSKAPFFKQIEDGLAKLPQDSDFRNAMTTLAAQSGQDLDKFRASVGTWYGHWADRLSGDYKRFSHYFALGFGLLVAVALNVDSLHLAKTLWTDRDGRAAMVAVAQAYGPKAPGDPTNPQQIAAAVKAVAALPLPIGWQPKPDSNLLCTMIDTVFAKDGSGLTVILGWLATALAVSLGAPFWFDTLQKFMNMRGTGPKPGEKAT